MSTLTVYDENGKQIKLTDNDYVSEGGEGKIFIKNNLVYKIYHDSKNVISKTKLGELSFPDKPNIIAPQGFVYNDKRLPLGYTMANASNTVPLPRLFTTSFRNRNSITPEMSISLVEKMIDTIQYIHEKKVLIVDGNEFNYLIDGHTFIDPFFIDVDSYQTASSPAKVIMPSIRDWQSKSFTEMTDWFSFAIIATQIFVGIHPFKGSNPDFDSIDIKDRIKERVLKNVSIFNKKTSVPPSTRSFNLIPKEYMDWFVNMFENGKRLPPPQIVTKFIQKPQVVISRGSNKFIITKLFETEGDILGVNFINGHRIIYIDGAVYLNAHKYPLASKSAGIIYHNNNPYSVDIVDGLLSIENFMNKEKAGGVSIKATGKLLIDNRIYIICDSRLSEIKLTEFGGKVNITVGNTWNILPNSTKTFREIIVEDILGKTYLMIPSRENACQQIAIPELDKCRILDGKFEDGIASFLIFKDNTYSRLIFTFDQSYSKYEIKEEKDISVYGINIVSLPNGIYTMMDEDGNIILGSRKASMQNIIKDTNIDPNAILCHDGTNVCYAIGNEFFSLRMK